MTEKEFRFMHSQLIEYYQLIEMRLGFICAAILADEEKNWFERLDDYKENPFGKLIHELRNVQKEKKVSVLTQDDLEKLDAIRKRRNYWVHQCFGGSYPLIYDREMMKRSPELDKMASDLSDAMEWDEKLTGVFKR